MATFPGLVLNDNREIYNKLKEIANGFTGGLSLPLFTFNYELDYLRKWTKRPEVAEKLKDPNLHFTLFVEVEMDGLNESNIWTLDVSFGYIASLKNSSDAPFKADFDWDHTEEILSVQKLKKNGYIDFDDVIKTVFNVVQRPDLTPVAFKKGFITKMRFEYPAFPGQEFQIEYPPPPPERRDSEDSVGSY